MTRLFSQIIKRLCFAFWRQECSQSRVLQTLVHSLQWLNCVPPQHPVCRKSASLLHPPHLFSPTSSSPHPPSPPFVYHPHSPASCPPVRQGPRPEPPPPTPPPSRPMLFWRTGRASASYARTSSASTPGSTPAGGRSPRSTKLLSAKALFSWAISFLWLFGSAYNQYYTFRVAEGAFQSQNLAQDISKRLQLAVCPH